MSEWLWHLFWFILLKLLSLIIWLKCCFFSHNYLHWFLMLCSLSDFCSYFTFEQLFWHSHSNNIVLYNNKQLINVSKAKITLALQFQRTHKLERRHCGCWATTKATIQVALNGNYATIEVMWQWMFCLHNNGAKHHCKGPKFEILPGFWTTSFPVSACKEETSRAVERREEDVKKWNV